MVKQNMVLVGIAPKMTATLESYFDASQFNFYTFHTAKELIDKIRRHKASLIFLNYSLPDTNNPQELCIALRSHPDTETIPIIIINSSDADQKEKITLFNAGLIDGYFVHPISIEELAAYANVFLQRQALQTELEAKNSLLQNISLTDELMQIYNRRYLIQRLDEEIKRIKRHNYPLSVAMLDIDFFKKINDKFGHTTGDAVLKKLAQLLKQTIRVIDIICRYGGEELIVISPHTNLEGARLLAERLRKKIKSYNFGEHHNPLQITLSIGIISFDGTEDLSFDKIIQALDPQLYKAKNAGRDCICAQAFKQA